MSHEGTPVFTSPPLGCDAHFHVFGPSDRYPYGGELRYAPPHAPLDDYERLAGKLGLTRMVFVQPSAYGRDNRCMLDAMRAVGTERCRGIVDVDESMPDAKWRELDALGVRGVRINVSPVKPPEPGFAQSMLARIHAIDAQCAKLGWHLDFLAPGWLTEELLPTFGALKSPHSHAHFGMFKAKDGPDQPGFRRLIELAGSGPRKCWIKLTGVYRMSTAPGFADVAPMARALIDAVPDRLIWGSDYPHLSFADNVGSIELWNLLGEWAPDEPTRRKILVDNPAALFRF